MDLHCREGAWGSGPPQNHRKSLDFMRLVCFRKADGWVGSSKIKNPADALSGLCLCISIRGGGEASSTGKMNPSIFFWEGVVRNLS